jgi:cytochrome d ubiquinol oxidase subunit I
LRCTVETRVARYAMLGAALVIVGGAGWYVFLPPSAQAALVGASALNILQLLIFGITALVIVMMYVGPYRNPGWLNVGFAILFFGLGLAAVGTGEFIREAVRKPFIVYNVVYSHGVYPSEIHQLQQAGYAEGGAWTRAWMQTNYPELVDAEGRIDEDAMLRLAQHDQQAIGHMLFMYHCNDCHAVEGYSGVAALARGWTPDMVELMVRDLNRFRYFMPEWTGTAAEAEILATYLESITPAHPFATSAAGTALR